MRSLAKAFLVLFFLFGFVWKTEAGPLRGVALLDLTGRRGVEEIKPNLYGADQALKVAGLSYVITRKVNSAVSYAMIVISAPFDASTFTPAEKDLLKKFVREGGILLSPYTSDSSLYPLFGIYGIRESYDRKKLRWKTETGDPSLKWFDDLMEKTILFAGKDYAYSFKTVSFASSGAFPLAVFDDGSIALCGHRYGRGYAYIMGFSFKNTITRNFLGKSLDAYRTYSNGFEPASDTIMLFVRALYCKHIEFPVWKKTSPLLSKATFIMTHDLCAKSIVEMMEEFSELEYQYGIVANYNATTTYERQEKRPGGGFGGFYDENEIRKLRRILNQNHKISSHSVNHFPDFDRFPEGKPGNTKENYKPYFDGEKTIGGTVYGEVELSKKLLDHDIGVNVRTFRSGYLLFNDKLYNVLEGSGYSYDSTRSANAVLTNFPYRGIKDRSYDGEISEIYEIPMTISDVIENFSESNYREIADMWLDITIRNARNLAPTVLLIHPNREYKKKAEERLLLNMPSYMKYMDMDSFGDFWRSRDNFHFRTELIGRDLKIIILDKSMPLDTTQSLIIEGGQQLNSVIVLSENRRPIPFMKAKWGENDLLIYWGLEVKTERYVERAWSIRKLVAKVILKFHGKPPESFSSFVLYKKEGKGIYKPLMVIPIEDFQNGQYIYVDEEVEMGKVYTYKVEVLDSFGRKFAVSNEYTL